MKQGELLYFKANKELNMKLNLFGEIKTIISIQFIMSSVQVTYINNERTLAFGSIIYNSVNEFKKYLIME